MYFVESGKEVVGVADDVLVGAGEEEADVVVFVFAEFVHGDCFAGAVFANELFDFAIGVAGDVGK